MENPSKEIVIVPHTHWDREWYKPFQTFRFNLIKLIDDIIEIMSNQDYYFMLDGQTIVLEDYFEIRPENKSLVLDLIRSGKLAIGPWYLLPDEWLVGEESLIRNLEISNNLARELDFPLMQIAYLPDQFGHSQAIPQIIADLTEIKSTVLWRGVGHEITTVPFTWKRHKNSPSSILGIYMPFGYGNAATLPESKEELGEEIQNIIKDLDPFSPLPVYLLMNGTDHQFAKPMINKLISEVDFSPNYVSIGLLSHFVDKLQNAISKSNYSPNQYVGEFRSPARAPLLQNTYSARIWIKIWNQKAEDLLVNYAEPISTYLSFYNLLDYPSSFLNLSWKWLLKNHPHDSICGCSVDETHEEMKSRFSWSETISKSVIEDCLEKIKNSGQDSDKTHIYVFNHTNSKMIPQKVEFKLPSNMPVVGLRSDNGEEYLVQPIKSSEEIVLDENLGVRMMRSGMKMMPGRKLMDFYLNEAYHFDGADPSTCEIRLAVGNEPIGDFNVKEMKKEMYALLDSNKYKKFHIIASKGSEQSYACLVPLTPWGFTHFEVLSKLEKTIDTPTFTISKKKVTNQFYDLQFNGDGTFSLFDKINNVQYTKLHQFEDTGDRGDLYSFGELGPTIFKISNVKRKILSKGVVYSEIEQKLNLVTFKGINSKRNKRIGKVKIPIKTIFRFYHDISRIDIETTLTNFAKDHRIRICFNLPFSSLETITATHFGTVRRRAQPDMDQDYIEKPTGIQAQKRFIRIESDSSNSAITLINKGLPEIELKDNYLAMTLLRSVGYLSRSDFPERPIAAGPSLETPGAQELNQTFTYNYSFITHTKNEDITYSSDHSEVYSLPTTSINKSKLSDELLNPVFIIDNPWIRVSSVRQIDGDVIITLYNLAKKNTDCLIGLHTDITKCSSVQIDGTNKRNHGITNKKMGLKLEPMEIMMLKLNK